MKKNKIFLVIILVLMNFISAKIGLTTTSSINLENTKTSVTYVGNAGFLVEVGDKKILIDAIFKGYNDYKLPHYIQNKIANSEAPFDGIDLILVTHPHGDHLDLELMTEHLKNNPKTILASTELTVELMKDVNNKKISFNPQRGTSENTVINGISIEAFSLPHYPPQKDRKPLANLGYLITVNGVKFFHTGDIDYEYIGFDEIRNYKLPEKKIDIAFLQHFYLTDSPLEKKLVSEAINSKYVFASHYHFTTPAYDKKLVKSNYPKAIVFDKELESWEMPLDEEVTSNEEYKEKLFGAVDSGNLIEIKTILDKYPTLLNSLDQWGNTPLIRSCFIPRGFKRFPEIAKYLISLGADVNVVNRYNLTALMRACVGLAPDHQTIKELVENGADVNFMSNNGLSPLHYAALYRDQKLAEFLLEKGAKINLYDSYKGEIGGNIEGTVVQVSINFSTEDKNITKYLIENGATINKKDRDGNNELHLAVYKGNKDLVEYLAQKGVEINAKNNFGKTPLHYAAKHGFKNIYEKLIELGADGTEISEKNFGNAKELSKNINLGEAYIWDLGGYTHAIKTKNNFLIFTLSGRIDTLENKKLANGRLNPDELKDQNVSVFLRNRSYWQPNADDVEKLNQLSEKVKIYSCFEPIYKDDKNKKFNNYTLATHHNIIKNENYTIYPFNALAGGMGYLLEVDGLKILHAGLHICDEEEEHIKKFKEEVDWLKQNGKIDILFLTTWSHSNKVSSKYEQHLYLLDELKPDKIYLFAANTSQQYKNCAEAVKKANIPVLYPDFQSPLGIKYYHRKKNN